MNKNQENPFFSIVTICFNNYSGLKLTHESIKSQTFNDYEWVIVDGNSTDNTKGFLDTLVDTRYSWASETDAGIYDAMNKGLTRSSGEYVIFMNSDDEFADENVLSNVFNELDSSIDIDFLYGDSIERTPQGELFNKTARSHRNIWYGMFTHHQAMFYNRKKLSGLHYRNNFKIGGDYALTSEFLSMNSNIKRVNFPICIYLLGGLSAQMTGLAASEQKIVWTEVLKIPRVFQLGIRLTQQTALLIRKNTPWFYSLIRFKK